MFTPPAESRGKLGLKQHRKVSLHKKSPSPHRLGVFLGLPPKECEVMAMSPSTKKKGGVYEVISEKQDSREYVICRYIRRNGKIIYPKNGEFFCFPVKEKKASADTSL